LIELQEASEGIGAEFATVLTREVFYRPFQNRRQVASYVGLTPAPYDSGDTKHDQGINKAGNTRARATAVQMAWLWLRYQSKSELSLWYYRRVGDLKGRGYPCHQPQGLQDAAAVYAPQTRNPPHGTCGKAGAGRLTERHFVRSVGKNAICRSSGGKLPPFATVGEYPQSPLIIDRKMFELLAARRFT
jgi:hypothetical protein